MPGNVAESVTLNVPTGAVVLCVTNFRNAQGTASGTNIVYEETTSRIGDVVRQLDEQVSDLNKLVDVSGKVVYDDKYLYDCRQDLLRIVYNDGGGTEYLFEFKKCMANDLYTFYKVYYRLTERVYPVMPEVSNYEDFVLINSTSSDNIGPLNMRYGSWTGGNHLSGNVKTAYCEDYSLYADNKIINSGDVGLAKSIVVVVHNIIYDPAVAAEEGASILSTKLCDEYVRYSVNRNTIEVSLNHNFVSMTTNSIMKYYGMQSMFVNESQILTPSGEFSTWLTLTADAYSFTKGDYDKFHRFIEYSNSGYYQSTYLYPKGIGNHRLLSDSDDIFIRSSGKSYHSLIFSELNNIQGLTYSWKGSYTFFAQPIIRDTTIFAYWGTVEGRLALFISSSQAFTGYIHVPAIFKNSR